ncbi:endonuclease-reverse transcriptase [Trichonephila clavipes]|nr:endonuclease-reverse transcriptase [Trichonephila clavipes]
MARHIWRSPENNQTRAYTFKNPMGSRTRGRPPTRWIDDVENDLKTLNIKNWQRVAAYRWNWRKRAVEAAKTRNRFIHLNVEWDSPKTSFSFRGSFTPRRTNVERPANQRLHFSRDEVSDWLDA